MICPICKRCPFAQGVCEDRVNRGRRYFLMGALALPVARKLEALVPIVAPSPALMSRFCLHTADWRIRAHDPADDARALRLEEYMKSPHCRVGAGDMRRCGSGPERRQMARTPANHAPITFRAGHVY